MMNSFGKIPPKMCQCTEKKNDLLIASCLYFSLPKPILL